MALSNYSDILLFRSAENVLGIFPLNVSTDQYVTPTYTQSAYETELVNQYNTGMTENERKVAEYRTNTLANFVTGLTAGGVHVTGATIECRTDVVTFTNSSGGTFTLDLSCVGDLGGYWSASSVDGKFIVNSGMTTSLVGIGTTIPNHPLSVSGNMSASSTVFGGGLNINGTTTFNDGDISDVGVIYVDKVTSDADSDVYIDLGTSGINLEAAAGDKIVVNDSAVDVDFNVKGDSVADLLYVDASTDRIGIGTDTPDVTLAVGEDGVGFDVKFYGTTSTKLTHWDSANDRLTLTDSTKLTLGTSNDLEIYHNGANSFIDDAGTGNLKIRSGTLQISNLAGTKTSAEFNSGAGQELYHNNTLRFTTSNTGVKITDDLNISGDTYLRDDKKIKLGDTGSTSAQIYYDSTANKTIFANINVSSTLNFQSNNTIIFESIGGGKDAIKMNTSGSQEFYDNGTIRLSTTSTGIVVTNDLNVTGNTVSSGSTSFSGLTHDQIYDMRDYEDSGKALPSNGDGTGFMMLGTTHGSVTTAGMLCNMVGGGWYPTTPTNAEYTTGATGVALDVISTSSHNRILLQGFVRIPTTLMNDALVSATDIGKVVFADPDTAGEYTIDPSEFTSNEYVKAVGHIMDYDSSTSSYLLYINPSTDFIKVA